MNWLMVFIGGGAGSILRFGIAKLLLKFSGSAIFPFATLISNISATVFMLLLVNYFKVNAKESVYFLLVTGFCGGFSTFSAFSYETALLLNTGNIGAGILNILVSVMACVLLAFLLLRL